jgi:hypothetical protein
MDRFRIRTGELLGIVVPGIVLLGNLSLILAADDCNRLRKLFLGGAKSLGNQAVFIFVVFLASYVVGFALRLLPPDPPDRVSGFLRVLTRWPLGKGAGHLWDPFPYWELFKSDCADSYPTRHAGAYLADLQSDFESIKRARREPQPTGKNANEPEPLPIELLRPPEVARVRQLVGRAFDRLLGVEDPARQRAARSLFNSYKLVIVSKCPALADEVFLAEGLTRLVTGLIYASTLGLLMGWWTLRHGATICGDSTLVAGVLAYFLANGALLLTFLYGIRHVRAREAFVVYHSYAAVCALSKEEAKKAGG